MLKKQPLTSYEIETLQEAQKNSPKAHFRNRCLAVELHLSRNKSVTYIAELLKVQENSVYEWLVRWEIMGLVGLMILPGRGVKSVMSNLLQASNSDSIELIKKKLKPILKN